jgi:N utilization substance protein B
MAESSRHRARELVLHALYASSHNDLDPESNLSGIMEEEKFSGKNAEFARHLFQQVGEHQEWADGIISGLAKNWALERIAMIDRTILRMGLVELEKIPQTPVKVVLNEAIELAKTYSTAESSSFINGVLDQYVQQTTKSEG